MSQSRGDGLTGNSASGLDGEADLGGSASRLQPIMTRLICSASFYDKFNGVNKVLRAVDGKSAVMKADEFYTCVP